MLASSVPPKFPIPFGQSAGGGFIRPIPIASQIGVNPGFASLTDGFPPLTFQPIAAGGIPPFGQDMNGVLNQITKWNLWQAAGAATPYDATFSAAIGGYPLNSVIASATAGNFWLSTVDGNTTNPNTGGAGWVDLGIYLGRQYCGVSTGAPNAQIINLAGATAYANQWYTWLVGPGLTNTLAGPTVNLNGLGAVTIYDGTGPANPSSLITGNIVSAFFDGTVMQLGSSPTVIDARKFGVKADGVTDDAPAVQRAVNAANGGIVLLPPGTLVFLSSVQWITTTQFAPGMHIQGAGENLTFIDNRVANNAAFFAASSVNFNFQLGGWIKDLSIITTTHPANSIGIAHKAVYQYQVERVHIDGMSADGIQIICAIGDADACNIGDYDKIRVENCQTGFNCNFAAGVTQPSFISIKNSFFSNCSSAGIRWIGLQGRIDNSAVVISGIGLLVPYNGSNNAQLTVTCLSFENNNLNMRLDSLDGGTFDCLECANSVVSATVGFQIGFGTGQVQNCKFDGTRVRINPAFTPFTMFNFGAQALCNVIENTAWNTYDAAGQLRYAMTAGGFGNRIDDYAGGTQIGSNNGVFAIVMANGNNFATVLPLDGQIFGISGPTAAFNLNGMLNGFDGRRVTIINTSGQAMTILNEDASSAAATRIRTPVGASYLINNQASLDLVYLGVSGGFNRWFVIGH